MDSTPERRRQAKKDVFAFIATQAEAYAVTRLLALYGVTLAGYHAWWGRAESAHAGPDRQLTQQIIRRFKAHRGGVRESAE
jgi:hypothetical protein